MKKTIFQKTIALLMVLTVSLSCMTFSAFAADESAVMTVAVGDGAPTSFTTFNDGWVYAMEQSLTSPATVTLLADWVATDGKFYTAKANGSEYGTDNGRIRLDDNHIITIDLNGHKIDRNLKEAKSDGQVFSLTDYDTVLTIKDSVGGGKITGANNTGDGGAFYMHRGSLFIEGGEISGNRANNGAGIFAASRNNLCITGGKITGNTATKNGGGIYGDDWGPFYFGGDVVISGNIGNGVANNLYLEDDDVVIRRAAGQQDGVIPNVPFKAGASIGISTYRKNNTRLTGSESYFGWDDYTYFFSDDSAYGIRPVYNSGSADWTYENDSTHRHMMYLDSTANIKIPKLIGVGLTRNAMSYAQGVKLDAETQVVTATLYYEHARTLDREFLAPSYLYDSQVNVGNWYIDDSDAYFYWSNPNPMKYRIVSSDDGTYGTYTLVAKWVCIECTDNTGDAKCDDCGKDVNLVAIGEVGYPTLQDAVNAAQKGDTIKFLADNVLINAVIIPEGKEITIDFVGKRLMGNKKELNHGDYLIVNNGNLTITDTVGDPNWRNIEYYCIKTYGPLTINEGDFAVVQGQCNIVHAINAPVTINAGIFTCAGYGASINAEGNSVITINGGWFQNDAGGCTMEASGNPKFYINGGTFMGNNSKSGDIDCVITGGIFVPSEAYFAEKYAAPGHVVAANANASKYAVVDPGDYVTYLGAGLKYAGASPAESKIRFGYDFADDFDLTTSNWRWKYGTDKRSLLEVAGENFDENNVTNLVVSRIPASLADTPIYAQLIFDVNIDGDTYTVEDTFHGTYLTHLASSIIANPNESAAVKTFAEQLMEAAQAAKK